MRGENVPAWMRVAPKATTAATKICWACIVDKVEMGAWVGELNVGVRGCECRQLKKKLKDKTNRGQRVEGNKTRKMGMGNGMINRTKWTVVQRRELFIYSFHGRGPRCSPSNGQELIPKPHM